MIRLIVSDMDGTLLNDEKQIDTGIYDLLPVFKEKGIRFVVASGRQYPSLKQHFKAHIEDVVVIAENGAFVVDDGRELLVHPMNQETIRHCISEARKIEGAEPLVCGKYHSYTSNRELYDFLSSPKFNYSMKLVDDLYQLKEGIIKVSLIEYAGNSAESCYERLRPSLREDLHLVISGPGCLDIGLDGINKGAAVEELQRLWKITPEETMVFGDQFNDVDMMQKAYYSYAMQGASEGVRKFARFDAGSNNDGAVVKTIREMTGL